MAPYGPDSIQAFLQAADQRFQEASNLDMNGHGAGAIYLFGYVVEMLVKAASYRSFGYDNLDPILPGERTAIELMIRAEGFRTRLQHDLAGWGSWLVNNKHALTGRAYPLTFGRAVMDAINVVHQVWHPDMRYRRLTPAPSELAGVRSATTWLRTEYAHL